MKNIAIRISVAVFACFLGVVAATVKSRFTTPKRTQSASFSVEERWHRLYEAAGMSGDSEILNAVDNGLLCANRFGVPDAVPIEIQTLVRCQTHNGTIHELKANDTSEYGSFHHRIKSSHATWSLQNLDFIKSVNTRDKATLYVQTHQWPPEK